MYVATVPNRTLANLCHWPPAQLDIVRSRPYGNVAAVPGTLRRLQLDRLIDKHSSRELDLVAAMIVARVLEPTSKLATSPALHPDTLSSTLSELLHLDAPLRCAPK